MSDDIDDTPILVGEPLAPDEMTEQLTVSHQDLLDAIEWWDSYANDEFVGALG